MNVCTLCGGEHFGSYECPFQCAACHVNTGPCVREDCERNRRYEKERVAADLRRDARSTASGPGVYRHIKTGRLYRILHDSAYLEATKELVVVYQCTKASTVWVRSRQEFFDGRFVLVSTDMWDQIDEALPHLPEIHQNPIVTAALADISDAGALPKEGA